MCSGPGGFFGGACLLFLGFDVGLEVVVGGSRYETLGVDLQEVGFEAGSVQWLMMIEFIFEASLIEARGVFTRDVSAKNDWTSQLWFENGRVDELLGTCRFWLELSCSIFKWLIMLENVLDGSLGQCFEES